MVRILFYSQYFFHVVQTYFIYSRNVLKNCGISNMQEFLYTDLEQNINSQQDMKVASV